MFGASDDGSSIIFQNNRDSKQANHHLAAVFHRKVRSFVSADLLIRWNYSCGFFSLGVSAADSMPAAYANSLIYYVDLAH